MIEKKLKQVPENAITKMNELLKEGKTQRVRNWYLCFRDSGYDIAKLSELARKYNIYFKREDKR